MKLSFASGHGLVKNFPSQRKQNLTQKFLSSWMNAMIISMGGVFLMSLSGCVSEKLNQPVSKQTKIGVVSLLGKSQFVLDENSAPTKTISPSTHIAFAHGLPGETIDQKLAENIVNGLHEKGYSNVAMINLPPDTNVVQALKTQKDLAMILVISPDAGRAPEDKFAQIQDEQVFGYGAFFQDSQKNQHTYAYLNYDISVYNGKDLQLISTASYNQNTELPFAHFASNYHEIPHTTVASLENWMNNRASPLIQTQAIQTLDSSFA
jgi:hypothetical protein